MRVYSFGEGSPEVSVVFGIHGDEVSGIDSGLDIVSDIDDGVIDVLRPVQFVFVNEEAYDRGSRFCNVDLNRVFPGSLDSDVFEERLASELLDVVEGTVVLDVHSTVSYSGVFSCVSSRDMLVENSELIRCMGIDTCAVLSDFDGEFMQYFDEGLCVEVGVMHSERAFKLARLSMMQFLSCTGVIGDDYGFDAVSEEIDVFETAGCIEGEGVRFVGDNFSKVGSGEVFGVRDDEEIVAEELFYPILMSTDGYSEIVGYRGEYLGVLDDVVGSCE